MKRLRLLIVSTTVSLFLGGGCLGPHVDYRHDGTAPEFSWETGPANELVVFRIDELGDKVADVWQLECPDEVPCIPPPVTLGVVPDGSVESVGFSGELLAGFHEVWTRTIGVDGVQRTQTDGFEVEDDIIVEEAVEQDQGFSILSLFGLFQSP